MKRASYLLCLSLVACGGSDIADLQEFVAKSGEGMRGKLPPTPEIIAYQPFSYDNPNGLPDPFKPRKRDLKSGGHGGPHQPNFDRHREMLEEFPLDSLKMIGSVLIHKVNYALVRAPDGKVHQVRAGNYLGQNFGLVLTVSDSEIKIREAIQDSNGDWSERISALPLAQ